MVTGTYQYNNLDQHKAQIRLLEVFARQRYEHVRCRLRTYNLDDEPDFTALSYRWGSGVTNSTIILNDQRVQIGKNLWRFLNQIAELNPKTCVPYTKLFWIDAICINQRDQEERTHQVAQMARIYKSASHVLVWLGPAYESSDLAMKQVAKLRLKVSDSIEQKRRLLGQMSLHAVLGICARMYWTRLWIFQELVLARNVVLMCGGYVAPWSKFMFVAVESQRLLNASSRSSNPTQIHLWESPAHKIASQIKGDGEGRSLFELIMATGHLGCAEIRDKIYALLGIAQSGHHGIEPRYQRSLVLILNEVIRKHYLENPPMSLFRVEKQLLGLAKVFDLQITDILKLEHETQPGQTAMFVPSRTLQKKLPLMLDYSPLSLWWACRYDHAAVQRLLARADPNLWFKAINAAADFQDSAIVNFFLEASSFEFRKHTRKEEDFGIIHKAVRYGHGKLLDVCLNADLLTYQDVNGRTALHAAAQQGDLEVVQRMLPFVHGFSKSRIDRRIDRDSRTALHVAARNGHAGVVELLLRPPFADCVHSVDSRGRTPLHLAAGRGHIAVVELLLAVLGAVSKEDKTSSISDKTGRTPLHEAALTAQRDMFDIIAQSGVVDVDQQDDKGRSAASLLKRAIRNNATPGDAICCEDVNCLATASPLHYAARMDDGKGIHALFISNTIDVNARWYSKELDRQLALAHGRDTKEWERGWTALHEAVRSVSVNAVQALLQGEGIDLDSKVYGVTALELANMNLRQLKADVHRPRLEKSHVKALKQISLLLNHARIHRYAYPYTPPAGRSEQWLCLDRIPE